MTSEGNPLLGNGLLINEVVTEYKKLIKAFDPSYAPGDLPRGTKLRVAGLTEKYQLIWDCLSVSCDYINGEWPHIENNAARCHEVGLFLQNYKALLNVVLEFDDKCICDDKRADEVLGESTLSMDYVYMLSVYDKQLSFVDSFLYGISRQKEKDKSKYYGLADRLMFHISGITQEQLENFIERDEFPLLIGNWTGSKRDATYFGHYFGKECWQMNRMFYFSTEGNGKSRLNYSQNSDENVKPTDQISVILKDYPSNKKIKNK